jgi:hypothetical protein
VATLGKAIGPQTIATINGVGVGITIERAYSRTGRQMTRFLLTRSRSSS